MSGNGNGTSTALAVRDKAAKTVHEMLVKSKTQIQAALPSHMNSERMIRVALTTIRQTPQLLNCTPISLVKCVMQAAALGLEPDPLLGRAYIVPFGTEATLIIGYKGIIDLARRSGEIVSLQAHVVYDQDHFHYELGTGERLTHQPASVEDRGKVTHAWALATYKGGGYQFEVMDFWELEAVRKMSKKPDSGPWRDHRPEMYRKTVLRRLGKFLPLSPQLASHLAAEEMIESGFTPSEVWVDENDEGNPPSDDAAPSQSKSEALTQRLGGKTTPIPTDTKPAGELFTPPPGRQPGEDG